MKKKTITAIALGAAAVTAGMATGNASADNVSTNNSQIEISAKKATSQNQTKASSESEAKSDSTSAAVSSEASSSAAKTSSTAASAVSTRDNSQAASGQSEMTNASSESSAKTMSNGASSESNAATSSSAKNARSASSSAKASSTASQSSSETAVNPETAGFQAHGIQANEHNIPAMVKKEAAQNKEKFEQQLVNPDARAAYDKLNANAKEIAQAANVDLAKLTHQEIDALNSVKMDSTPESGTVTYTDYADIAKDLINRNPQYAIPQFDPSTIKNFPAATTADAETGKVEPLDIWDSWPVMNANTGAVTDWNGYQLVFGMAGSPANPRDNHLYLFYTKYGDENFNDWKCAGPVFGFGQNSVHQRWSGSACVNSDGTIQLYYTDVDTSTGHNDQRIATVTITLANNNGQISIANRQNEKILFAGDGKLYQTRTR